MTECLAASLRRAGDATGATALLPGAEEAGGARAHSRLRECVRDPLLFINGRLDSQSLSIYWRLAVDAVVVPAE